MNTHIFLFLKLKKLKFYNCIKKFLKECKIYLIHISNAQLILFMWQLRYCPSNSFFFLCILRITFHIDLLWQHQISQVEEATSKILAPGHCPFNLYHYCSACKNKTFCRLNFMPAFSGQAMKATDSETLF